MSAPSKRDVELLITYLGPQRSRVVVLALLLFGSIGLELANPQILRSFIDTALAGGAPNALVMIALLFLGVTLASQLVSVAETYVAESVGLTATNWLRADLALHCLRLDPAFHNARSPGELIERVDGDVATLGNFFSRFVVHLLGNAILLIGVLALLFRVDWRVGLALTLFTIVALAVVNSLRKLAVPQWVAARQASAELFGFLEERLAGTEDIRANGATAYAMRRLYERGRNLLRRQRHAGLLGAATGNTTVLFLTLGTAVALALAAYLFNARAITIGTVFLIFSYTEMLRRPIEQITRQMQDLQQATASMTRIQSLLHLRSAVQDGAGASIPADALSVEFQGVSFSYDDRPLSVVSSPLQAGSNDRPRTTLHDISFQIAPGQVLGVLGRTGSGKTTITRLLFRLYDPAQGTIRLGGVDLRDARIADVRRHVGMVTQDIQLFHASVRDNLAFFDPAISDERIERVLDDLGLTGWYRGLPQGLSTKLAPGGSGLSAGEAQLLAFARVFLKDPGLVILDEASSRLDPASERRLERAVSSLLRPEGSRRTGIIIAHRLSTVQRADAILILEDGQIREYGPREMLANDPSSRFSQLLRTGMEEVLV